jgi:hypothetical protein
MYRALVVIQLSAFLSFKSTTDSHRRFFDPTKIKPLAYRRYLY